MQHLAIHLFGSVAVTSGAGEIRIGRSAMRVLAYLALYAAQPLPREVVAAELWPDSDEGSARSRLSTALWRLRSALGPARSPDLLRRAGDGAIGLDPAAVEAIDTRRFERRARAFLASPHEHSFEDEAEDERGRGVPMAGWYDFWALSARLRIEDLRERCLSELLARQCTAGEDQPAIDTAEKLLRIDPLREDVHQALMRIHARHGRPALVERQYERCRQAVGADLGIEPAAETEALRQSFCRGRPPTGRLLSAPPVAATEALRQSLSQSRQAVERLRSAPPADRGEFRRQLHEARHGLARLTSMIDTMLER